MKAYLRIGNRGIYVVGLGQDLQAWPGDVQCRPSADGRGILHFSRFIEPVDEESRIIVEYVAQAAALLDEAQKKIKALRQARD